MEAWERMWVENYVDLAADAAEDGDWELYDQSLAAAREIARQAEQRS